VLAFTPEVDGALRWFEATHELTNADGRFWWRRVGLPGPGSVGEQDARLMEALEVLQRVYDDLMRPKTKTRPNDDA